MIQFVNLTNSVGWQRIVLKFSGTLKRRRSSQQFVSKESYIYDFISSASKSLHADFIKNLPIFSCYSSSIRGTVFLLVRWLVGWCQRVSRSMKCLKDALYHNDTVFYALCITVSAYYTICIEDTINFVCIMHMIPRILLVKAEMK